MKERSRYPGFPTPVRPVVEKVLSDIGLGKLVQANRIIKSWDKAVGPTIAGHAQPRSLRNGTLIVDVDSSSWLAQLDRYRKVQIQEKLNKIAGKFAVKRVVFMIGEVQRRQEEE